VPGITRITLPCGARLDRGLDRLAVLDDDDVGRRGARTERIAGGSCARLALKPPL
jgi:hypothetical protein